MRAGDVAAVASCLLLRMRKFLDAGYARQRHPADARSQREWKELVQDFARANGLPSPEAALQHSECDSSTPHLSDSQNAFLDFLDALVVQFITAWLCGQRPLRQTAYRFLEHDDWSYKKIGQFSYHLDRSSLLQWKYVPWLWLFHPPLQMLSPFRSG